MVKQVRKALKGVIAGFFIVALVLAFALEGIPGMSNFGGDAAIEVGDQRFSQSYIQNEFNRAVQARRIERGGAYSTSDAIAEGLGGQVIDQISTLSAITQYANKLGLAASTDMVRDYLHANEAFQNPATGAFDEQVLRSILQRNGISAEELESRIAEDLLTDQLMNAIAARAGAPDALLDPYLLREREERAIRYLTVTEEMAGKAQEPNEADLQAFYDDNPAAFTAPEYRIFDLVLLRSEDFQDENALPEEELRAIYERNKERLYDTPERRTFYQVSFETEAEAANAVAGLRGGEPFEKIALAKGQSLDTLTLTEQRREDVLNPAVAAAAFAEGLQPGDSPDPVQSPFGWSVLQIVDIIPAETSRFEDKRSEIAAQYAAQDVRRAVLDAIDLIEEARDGGADLAGAAETAGLSVERIGPVDRLSFAPGGAILDNIPGEALRDAFLLEEGEETEAEPLTDNEGYFFLALQETLPPALRPFDEVRDAVDAAWRAEERRGRLAGTVENIRASLDQGEGLIEAAALFDRAPIAMTIDRFFENDALSVDLVRQVFETAPGAVISGPAAFGDAQIIVEITDITYEASRIPPDQRAFAQQFIGLQLDRELVDTFVVALRQDADVKINQRRIDAIFNEGL